VFTTITIFPVSYRTVLYPAATESEYVEKLSIMGIRGGMRMKILR